MIRVHDDALGDLRRIINANPSDGAKLLALIEQLRTDKGLQARLLDQGFGERGTGEKISVKKWGSIHRIDRVPAWRLRAWMLERDGLNYRLLYINDWKEDEYVIIAVVAREGFDYDDQDHPIRKRIRTTFRTDFPGR